MNINDYNPWWKHSDIDTDQLGKRRNIFEQVWKFIDSRQVLVIKGLRRVGKTTLIYQLIDTLLKKGTDPFSILYYSLDNPMETVENVLNFYLNEVMKNREKETAYLFLDEIQKEANWSSLVKRYYDMYPNLKFILTGSVSLDIMQKAKESLAGRYFSFQVEPLDFKEYLGFIDYQYDPDRLVLYYDELEKKLIRYIFTGGFPELIDKDDEFIRKYISESLLGRIISQDIKTLYNIQRPPLLTTLFKLIATQPGMLLNYQNIANDLGSDVRTIENYISVLEEAYLIHKVYNYSKNQLTSEKKLKKVYPYSPGFSVAFHSTEQDIKSILPILIETVIVNKTKYFYRYRQYETDAVFEKNNHIIPIEVKYRNKISIPADCKGLLHFMKEYNITDGMVITKNQNEELNVENNLIRSVSVFEYLLKE